MNAPVTTCPRCTAVLRRRGTRTYCPRCLVHTALSAPAPVTSPIGGADAPGTDEVAALFPDYEIVQLLGAGGMGLVYEARQVKLDRLVALKLLPAGDGALNPEFAERFTREARSLARLNHPDFVQVYDQGQVPGWFYIVMEFVDGPDLARVLKRDGPLAPTRALALFMRLCESLADAHRLGVVHRDLKPANLLLDHESVLKVADFGLAKLLDRPDYAFTLTNEQAALGTPYYMAPEQRAGSAAVDQRADIYALGVVLYEMLTGELPTGNFKPPSQLAAVSPAIDRVVLKALASDPGDRFQDLGELLAGLEKAKRPPLRRPALMFAAAGLLAVAVVAAILLKQLGGKRAEQDPAAGFGAVAAAPALPDFEWSRAVTLASPHPDEQGYFGQYGDVAGDLYAVSAPGAGEFGPEVEQAGRVHLYRLGDADAPKLLATLQAPAPRPGDSFGYPLDLAEDGQMLAVSSEILEEGESNSALCFYEPESAEQTSWRLVQTLTFERAFGGLDSGVRMVMSGPWMAVSSPEAPPAEAVRMYHRTAGHWAPHSVLVPEEELNEDSHYGFLCKFHEERLYVNAYRAGRGTQYRSGALYVFERDDADEWRQVQKLTHPSSATFAYFGLDWAFPAPDVLAVGSVGDSSAGTLGSGAVVLFARDAATGRWEHAQKFNSPDPYAGRAGFGQQLIGDGEGRLMVLSSEGSPTDGSMRSIAHVFEVSADPEATPRQMMRFRPEATERWLGRPLFGDRHLFIAAPNEAEVGIEAVGRVYVVPKEALAGRAGE